MTKYNDAVYDTVFFYWLIIIHRIVNVLSPFYRIMPDVFSDIIQVLIVSDNVFIKVALPYDLYIGVFAIPFSHGYFIAANN